MAYYRLGAYIMSDDFDRFFTLVIKRGESIIYTSAREKGAFRTATSSNISSQRFQMFRRWNDEQWLFIDPATQYNPNMQIVSRKESRVKWGEPLVMDMGVFGRARTLMRDAVANYRKSAL